MASYKEITVQIKRFAILSMKGCYRSVKGHPFLVGLVLFLIFLYRSFPFLFSLLLSASPVLVCTALLLGTLLSFGQPNIPEIEREEKLTRDVVSLRTGAVENNETFVVDRNASFVVERHVGDRRDLVDKSVEDTRSVDDRIDSRFEDGVDSPVCVPLIDENSRAEKMVVREVQRGFLEFEFEKNEILEEARIEEGALSDGKIVENHYSLVRDVENEDNLEMEVGYVRKELIGDSKEDRLESLVAVGGHDNGVGDHGDDEEEDDDDDEDGSSYSDSDRVESSSPDASMADIIPMLDELHPLLDLDAPQPARMSRGGSDAGSDHSHGSEDGSGGSHDGSENHRDEAEEDGVDDHEDDEEEAHGEKEDESKSAIKWTEDDQKNLMDLGTLELERNQRLENLIARRRARKSFRLSAEKNLIDLETTDLPFNVPQILTTRPNPFDLPDDSLEQMGLPPIPGSAPSILLPRRNPFDLPYDSNEEKPDLKGDNFEQEFLPSHQKEMMFRRHESFSLGPSGLGGHRHDARWKPVFVPDRLASEGASYSLFQRQSSEISESKLSSVPDTDSVSSLADTEEKKLSDQDFSKEGEMLSEILHASDLVKHGNQSFEDEDSMKIASARRQIHYSEDEIILGEAENHHESGLDLSESRETSADLKLNNRDIPLEAKPVEEEKYSSRSSLSSLSEGNDRIADLKKDKPAELNASTIHLENKLIEEEEHSSKSSLSVSSESDNEVFDVKNDDGSTSVVAGDDQIDESFIPAQRSLEGSEFRFMSGAVDDSENRDPVYDSSPHAADKLLSLSSISSDTQVEETETVKHSSSVDVDSSLVDQETESHGESILSDTSGLEDTRLAFSKVVAEDALHVVAEEVTESTDINVSTVSSSDVGQEIDNQSESVVRESGLVHDSVDSSSFSSESKLVEEIRENEAEISPNERGHACLSAEIHTAVSEDEHEDEKSCMVALSKQISSEDVDMPARQEEQLTTVVERASNFSNPTISESELLENWEMVHEETTHADEHHVQSDSSSEKMSIEDEIFKDELIHLGKDEVPSSSFDPEVQIESNQDFGAQLEAIARAEHHINSDDSKFSLLQEAESPLVAEQVSVESEQTVRSEAEQLHSEALGVNADGSTLQESDSKDVSSSSDDECVPSEEKSTFEFKKEQGSDLKVASSSSDDETMPYEEKSPLVLQKEQDSELNDASSSSDDESVALEDESSIKMEKEKDSGLKVASSSSDDEQSPSEENSQFKSEKELSSSDNHVVKPDDDRGVELHEQVTVMDEAKGVSSAIVDVCDPADTHSSDSIAFPTGTLEYTPHAGEIDLEDSILDRNFKDIDEVDEIKDIDEGLLYELDVVGDFGIEEVGESLHSDFQPEQLTVGTTEPEILPSVSNPKQGSSELPVLEVRSFEDIDLAFKQLHEGADVEEVILPSMVKEQTTVAEGSTSRKEITSDLQTVEATSLEEIQIALRQVSDGNGDELWLPLNSKSESAEVGVSESEFTSEIEPVKVESGVEEVTPVTADEQHESNESFEDPSTSSSKNDDKKSKDCVTKSGSSDSG